jgi:hypothetical protein
LQIKITAPALHSFALFQEESASATAEATVFFEIPPMNRIPGYYRYKIAELLVELQVREVRLHQIAHNIIVNVPRLNLFSKTALVDEVTRLAQDVERKLAWALKEQILNACRSLGRFGRCFFQPRQDAAKTIVCAISRAICCDTRFFIHWNLA